MCVIGYKLWVKNQDVRQLDAICNSRFIGLFFRLSDWIEKRLQVYDGQGK